jgi:hypothetical protein
MMVAAGMAFPVVVMVTAPGIGVPNQLAGRQSRRSQIRIAGHTAIEQNIRRIQSHPGTAADAAANQGIHLQSRQESGQCTVAAALGIHNLCRHDFSVFHIIDLELLGVAEMLENLTVFVGYRNSHNLISFRFSEFS